MIAPLDPATVLAQFIDRVAHYDPVPGADPVAAVAAARNDLHSDGHAP